MWIIIKSSVYNIFWSPCLTPQSAFEPNPFLPIDISNRRFLRQVFGLIFFFWLTNDEMLRNGNRYWLHLNILFIYITQKLFSLIISILKYFKWKWFAVFWLEFTSSSLYFHCSQSNVTTKYEKFSICTENHCVWSIW